MICPICGLEKGYGSVGVPVVTGSISCDVQVSLSVHTEGEEKEYCLGHEAAEHVIDSCPIPQLFYDAFKNEEDVQR